MFGYFNLLALSTIAVNFDSLYKSRAFLTYSRDGLVNTETRNDIHTLSLTRNTPAT